MTAVTGKDPGELYKELAAQYGRLYYARIDAPANAEQKKKISALKTSDITIKELAGDEITGVLTTAPGSNDPIGGVKVTSEGGWFAARPSGTEEIYKLYAESFRSADHLKAIQNEAQDILKRVFS
jgi:phosphoglucomutase